MRKAKCIAFAYNWLLFQCLKIKQVRRSFFQCSLCHVINPLLTKLVWSRWLDVGLALFLRELANYSAILTFHLVNDIFVHMHNLYIYIWHYFFLFYLLVIAILFLTHSFLFFARSMVWKFGEMEDRNSKRGGILWIYKHQEFQFPLLDATHCGTESEHQVSNGSLIGLFSFFILSPFTRILELCTK